MTKPVIVTRAGKGAPLTRAELDANFSNLDNATLGVSDGTNSGSLDLNDTLTFAASGNASVAYNSSTKTLTVGASGGGGSSGPEIAVSWTYTNGGTNVLQIGYGVLNNPNSMISYDVDDVVGRFQINSAGTYLIEVEGTMNTNTDGQAQLYDVTSSSNVGQLNSLFFPLSNSKYLVPDVRRVVTITSSNKYEFRVGGSLQGAKYLKITKLS